jgi:lantibiotic modifying enzyme
MLSGFGHGAAGLSLALLRGYEVSGNSDFLAAAQKGITFENTLYDDAVHNWRDMRDVKETGFMQGWCSGAPGIGLARLAGLAMADNADIRKDLEAAIMQTKQPFSGGDHYCCGQSGRADFLLEAAQRLDRPDLLNEAKLLMSSVVARSRNADGYLFNSQRIGVNPSAALYQGLSGVGYALLRCAAKELESVLV